MRIILAYKYQVRYDLVGDEWVQVPGTSMMKSRGCASEMPCFRLLAMSYATFAIIVLFR